MLRVLLDFMVELEKINPQAIVLLQLRLRTAPRRKISGTFFTAGRWPQFSSQGVNEQKDIWKLLKDTGTGKGKWDAHSETVSKRYN